MRNSLKAIASASLAIMLGAALGTAFAWQTASAVTVEDNTGNPDAAAPLADPDESAGASQSSGTGFSIIAPDQNGNNGLQWTFGNPSSSDDTTLPPAQGQ
ncbi:MAG TPA: hypothetical protein VM639_19110 [Dongiaceae bacterium]|nr:hypothetical protein [Dongiaceae bacterium]